MKFLKRITRSNFYIKLTNWEYWPFGIIQFPVILYYGWLALRSRSLMFFTASNPGITMGGMFGESKFDVLKLLPQHLIPKTIRIDLPATAKDVLDQLTANSFQLPVIFKPDVGERGFMVKRIDHQHDIENYLANIRVSFLIQSLVDLPLEFGIFYQRHPSAATGKVTSVVMKEMLTVTGDGRSTLHELILDKPRAKLQLQKLDPKFKNKLGEIIPTGEKLELVSIGNHARGTKFINGNHLINDRLNKTFDAISKKIEGFYFGRFDLRCATLDDLYQGKVWVVELNGCGAEPAHIYDPNFKLWKAVLVLWRHWRTIFEIARENRRRGVSFTPFKEGEMHYRKFKAATRY
jgi:hypothetical protein